MGFSADLFMKAVTPQPRHRRSSHRRTSTRPTAGGRSPPSRSTRSCRTTREDTLLHLELFLSVELVVRLGQPLVVPRAAGMVIQSTPARRCGSKTLVRQPRDTDRCSADRYSATTTDRYRRVRQLFAPPSLDVAPPPAPPPSPRARGWTNGEASAILWQLATQARKGVAVQPDPSQVNG